jgi:Protein of unknown function (DUF1569)
VKTLADGDRLAEIVARLRTVRPDSVGRWGRMSAHQMICHLADGCRMALGDKRVKETAVPIPRALLRWMVLSMPLPWPHGIPTSPEIDQRCGGTVPEDFAADVSRLEALLDTMTKRGANGPWARHPLFGRMSPAAWLRWGYRHAEHHLRQFGA